MHGRWAALFLLVACGGDDGTAQLVDSGVVDAKTCTTVTLSNVDVTDEESGKYVTYTGSIGEVNGYPTYVRMEFRHTATQIVLPPSIDLAAGVNASYATCLACFTATSIEPGTGAEVAHYFRGPERSV